MILPYPNLNFILTISTFHLLSARNVSFSLLVEAFISFPYYLVSMKSVGCIFTVSLHGFKLLTSSLRIYHTELVTWNTMMSNMF
jgi:hypothetical protein